MSVRAKFKVIGMDVADGRRYNEETQNKDIVKTATVRMLPVYEGSTENEEFFNATPAGDIRLDLLNEKTFSKFKVGKDYYIDFTEVE